MSMTKKSSYLTSRKIAPPNSAVKTNGSLESLAVDNKNVASASCSSPQNKTPKKSGLTPIHPGKSPGTGMKLKSGLTPVHPGAHHGQQSKSPFFTKPKLKSGLLPIKPNRQTNPTAPDFNNASFIARRKSGLQPIKPVGSFSSALKVQRNDDITVSASTHTFTIPKQGGMSYNSIPQSASRRKSGLLPVKKVADLGPKVASDRQFYHRPRPSMTKIESSSTDVKRKITVEATPNLKSIVEDGESPVNFRNISGLAPLDDTVNMSVVIRPRPGCGSSRLPLPRSTLDPAHFTSPGTMISRIPKPKRVLHFDEDCTVRSSANILKDGSSKINTETTNKISQPVEAAEKEKAALLQRKEEIENMFAKMSAELEVIKQKLQILQEKKDGTINRSENLAEIRDDDESDSPFAHVNSPVSAAPLELLTLDGSKRPENIYKVYRQSYSLLKTPQPSAFRKPNDALRITQQSKAIGDSPNVSQRLQKQLADLFDE